MLLFVTFTKFTQIYFEVEEILWTEHIILSGSFCKMVRQMTYIKEIINYEKNDIVKRTEYIQNIKGCIFLRNIIFG